MNGKNWKICGRVLAVVCATTLALAQEKQEPAPTDQGAGVPKLALKESEWDFGTVWYNTPMEHNVVLQNIGDAPLNIVSVKPSCGCTAATPEQLVIEPGGATSMLVKYDTTKNKQNVTTTVTITTNDPVRPSTVFRIKGVVKPCYELDPHGGAAFGQLMRETKETKTVDIRNTFEDKMTLKLEDFENPMYDVQLVEVEPGMHYKLTATTKPPLQSGNSRAEVVLKTNLERVPEIKIPLRAYVVPRVTVTPHMLYVPKVFKKASQKTLTVRSLAGNPVKVTEVSCSTPGVNATIKDPSKPSALGFQTQEIVVDLPPGSDLPDEGAILTLKTDANDPEFNELSIDIFTRPRVGKVSVPSFAQRPQKQGEDEATEGDEGHEGHDHEEN